jgi:general stress protein 26
MTRQKYTLTILSGNADETTLKSSIERIINHAPLISFATVDKDNKPHISNSYFGCTSLLQIVVLTSPEANHSKAIRHNPNVAVSVTDSQQLPSSRKSGLELQGKMHQAKGIEAIAAYGSYMRHMMPFFRKKVHGKTSPMSLTKKLGSRPYVVDVEIVKVFDEVALAPDTAYVARVERQPNR